MRLPTRPVSGCYGYDRGTPVDRHYIETFLASHAEPIHGDVLEIKDNAYTTRYGGTRVRSTTVLDIDPTNPQATLIADLTRPGALPEAAFDAIVLTQALQFFTEPALALTNCRQALRPGGSLLLTAPAVGRLSLSAPHADLWRVTPAGLGHLLASTWTGPVAVHGYGNLRACLAMLLGEAAEELTADERDLIDPGYPLVACAHARTV
jgi:SAM-dependent methyltransferase